MGTSGIRFVDPRMVQFMAVRPGWCGGDVSVAVLRARRAGQRNAKTIFTCREDRLQRSAIVRTAYVGGMIADDDSCQPSPGVWGCGAAALVREASPAPGNDRRRWSQQHFSVDLLAQVITANDAGLLGPLLPQYGKIYDDKKYSHYCSFDCIPRFTERYIIDQLP